MKRSAICVLVLCLAVTAVGAAAENPKADVSASVTGVFSDTVNGNGLQQNSTKSAGGLFSFRYYLNNWAGVEANYGYTQNSQKYSASGLSLGSVQTGMHEVTGAFVFHRSYGRLRPFALAGGGILSFNPTSNNSTLLSVSQQTRPTFLYGAGTDFKLTRLLSLRAQYRGLVYQAPDFQNSTLHSGSIMHTAEPSVGLVLKF